LYRDGWVREGYCGSPKPVNYQGELSILKS
jgi:hypothetical protein